MEWLEEALGRDDWLGLAFEVPLIAFLGYESLCSFQGAALVPNPTLVHYRILIDCLEILQIAGHAETRVCPGTVFVEKHNNGDDSGAPGTFQACHSQGIPQGLPRDENPEHAH
jgi:hypothetical protein